MLFNFQELPGIDTLTANITLLSLHKIVVDNSEYIYWNSLSSSIGSGWVGVAWAGVTDYQYPPSSSTGTLSLVNVSLSDSQYLSVGSGSFTYYPFVDCSTPMVNILTDILTLLPSSVTSFTHACKHITKRELVFRKCYSEEHI